MISVIVPVFNNEKHLAKCIDSILNQTYTDFELLLVNDGSTDKSKEICDAYSKIDDRIKVIHKNNEGVSKTRNLGIAESRGGYIAFIDGDDYVEDDYLDELYSAMQRENAEVSLCKYEKFSDRRVISVKENKLKNFTRNNSEADFECLFKFFFTATSTVSSYQAGTAWRMLFKKDMFPYRFNENLFCAEDLIFVLNNFACVNKISVVDKRLYHYRVNPASIIHSHKKHFFENQHELMKEIESFIKKLKISERKKEKIIRVQNTINTCILFGNEIKHIKNSTSKNLIEEYKRKYLYHYLCLRDIVAIKNLGMMIKCLSVYFLIRTNLYKVL